MNEFPKIILSSGKDQSLKRYHPWVFSGAIKKIEGTISEGDIAEIYSNKNEFLGIGHYQKGSIAVRIFSFTKAEPDFNFWKAKIENAYRYRQSIGLTEQSHTNMYRLIFGEGDHLPGLIIDIYKDTAVIQVHSIGMYQLINTFTQALQEILGSKLKAIYDKSSETLPKREDVVYTDSYLWGHPSKEHSVTENGHQFYINWKEGQKTGFFIDQRENRKLFATYAAGKSVLNTFCYSGAFSVYALAAGALHADSVDSSRKAIELTDNNIALNHLSPDIHTSHLADVFDFLKDAHHQYDLIVLDPPAFAKHHDSRHHALMGYKRLNAEAMRIIKPGGILFTFSCSQAVDRYLFNNTIIAAAILSGRKIRILHQLVQPPDHPVNIFHPEGEYLKGLVLQVE